MLQRAALFLNFCFAPISVSFGQASEPDSILQKIKFINSSLGALDTLSPFRDEDELIESLNSVVTENLLLILNDKKDRKSTRLNSSH